MLGLLAAVLLLRSSPRLGHHHGRGAGALVLALAGAAYLNAYFSYLPQVGDVAGPRPWPVASIQALSPVVARAVDFSATAARHPRGAVVTVKLGGASGRAPTRDSLIYLPPQYFSEPDRHFPVLYLLHGSPGVPLDWFRGGEAAVAGRAAAAEGRPVILVAPRMSSSWLADSECIDGPALRAESYLVDDVVPQVDRLLRTVASADQRGVLGNSAGGYCALTVGLRHPDVFSRVAALSPLTTPTYSYGSLADLFGNPADLAEVVAEHTPGWLLEHRPRARAVQLWLDVGEADRVRPQVLALARLDARLGGHPRVATREGGHTFQVWRPALAAAIRWFAEGVSERPAPS